MILAIPYIVQLLCVFHIIKTHRNTYWIWIIIILPYIGGIVYFLVEIAPDLFSAHKIDTIKFSVINIVKPNQRLEILEQRAAFSSTYNNMIEYADALMDKGDFTKALDIYNEQNKGAFFNDSELLYKISAALYSCEKYQEALQVIKQLIQSNSMYTKRSRENILYLSIIEKTENTEYVKQEYNRVLQCIQDNSIEIPYIQFLIKHNEHQKLKDIFQRIHNDERSLKINNIPYNKSFYHTVYRYEQDVEKK